MVFSLHRIDDNNTCRKNGWQFLLRAPREDNLHCLSKQPPPPLPPLLSGGAGWDPLMDCQHHHPPTGGGSCHGGKFQLRVLHTHQKTKEKDAWKDGMLSVSGTRCLLHNAHPVPGASGNGLLDTLELTRGEANVLRMDGAIGKMESEKFLIHVEGPWIAIGGGGGGVGNFGSGGGGEIILHSI